MQQVNGTRPEDVLAAIGPGIGACCYMVGEDVSRQFGFLEAGFLDLAAENRRQLEGAGVPRTQIDCLSVCTCCNPTEFYSWRRDRDRGARMISYVVML